MKFKEVAGAATLKKLRKEIQKGYDSATNGKLADWNFTQFKEKLQAGISITKKKMN